jgi:serine/threonine-protein kinase
VLPGYPKPLEAVVMRALERDPAKRYQTAAEMRLELLAVQRELDGTLAPDAELAARMAELFSDRIEEKRELLRRLRAGSDVTHVPEAEVDLEIELPSVVHDREDVTPSTVSAVPQPARRARWALAAAAVVLLGGLAAVGAILSDRTSGDAGQRAGRDETAANTGAASSDDEQGAARGPGESGSDEARETVTLEVDARPPGAVVFVDGERRGRAPVAVAVPRGERVLIEARRSGYRSAAERVVVTEDDRLLLRLRPRTRATAVQAEESPTEEIERFH